MGTDVVVLGSLNVDFVVRAERHPKPGETILGEDLNLYPGGKGANQAVASARAGAKTAMVGRIGNDPYSSIATRSLAESEVKLDCVLATPGCSTGSAFITVDRTGQNAIVVAPGANSKVSREDVSNAFKKLGPFKVLAVQLEIPLSTVLHGMREARAAGAKVILDPAPAAELGDEFFKFVDIITPNQYEAQFLTGIEISDEFDAARAASILIDKGVRTAIVKMGERGIVCRTENTCFHIPALQVEAVDTVAAGDAFAGALATALSEGWSLEEACRFAVAASGISVTRKGAQPSMPFRAEIDAVLENVPCSRQI